jgi:hypothetical protein
VLSVSHLHLHSYILVSFSSWWTSCDMEFLPIAFIVCPQCCLPVGPIWGFQLILDLMQAAFLTSRIICSTIIMLNQFFLYVLISNVVTQCLHVNISHGSLFFKFSPSIHSRSSCNTHSEFSWNFSFVEIVYSLSIQLECYALPFSNY